MKNLMTFIHPYRVQAVCAPLFKMFEAVLELFVPLVVAHVADVCIPERDRSQTILMCLLLIGIAAAGLLASVTAQYFSAKAAVGACSSLRETLFSRLCDMSCAQMDFLGKDTVITRLTGDINQVQTGVNMTLRLMLRSPFIVFGAAIAAATVDASVTWQFLLVIALLFATVYTITIVCLPLYRRVQERLDVLLSNLRETISGVRVIRAFRREKAQMQSFDATNNTLTDLQRFVGRISSLLNPMTYVIINGSIILLLYTGAIKIDSGSLSQGELIALYNYLTMILVELIKLADLIITATRSIACARRVSALLNTEPEESALTGQPLHTRDVTVEFRNVSMLYPSGGAAAISGISFTAHAGEHIGIIGGTGSGKSTLVNLIPRLYDAIDGEVLVCGRNVKEYDREALRRCCGIVPQRAVIFGGTISSNVTLGKENVPDEDIVFALENAQAAGIVAEKGGLSSRIRHSGSLSGGQMQRITVARALVGKPPVLIFDDSSSALDYITDANLRAALRENYPTATVFTVSQRTSSVADCDKIIVLEDGKCVGIGTHEELLNSCEVYREIHSPCTEGGVGR